jgi:hypothetical protein
MRKKLTILLLVAITLFACRYVHWGYRSSRASELNCYEIKRPYYPLRHWSWSGIFPFEGGFIPDPHFLCSEPMALPGPVETALREQDAHFQVIDVNPFFNDQSSEIQVVVRTSKSVFEYSLQFPKTKGVRAVIATPSSPARIFSYKDQLVLLANFSGPTKGLYLMPLPLQSGGRLTFISAKDPQFDLIAREFKNSAQDRTVKDQYCLSRDYAFITFYEKYSGPCEEASSSVSNRFDEFWKRD